MPVSFVVHIMLKSQVNSASDATYTYNEIFCSKAWHAKDTQVEYSKDSANITHKKQRKMASPFQLYSTENM